MRKQHYLFVGDSSAVLYNHEKKLITIGSFQDFQRTKIGSLNLIINTTELDINRLEIPQLSFLDRRQFASQRNRHRRIDGLHGMALFKDHLIELNCAISNAYLESWLQHFANNNITVKSIRPFLLLPQNTHKETRYLVISDHGTQGIRQTAFIGNQPLFTRLSKPSDLFIEEINTTIAYLNNQYPGQKIILIGYVKDELRSALSAFEKPDLAVQINYLEKQTLEEFYIKQKPLNYKFSSPGILSVTTRNRNNRLLNLAIAVVSAGLISSAVWQYQSLEGAKETIKIKQNLLAKLKQTMVSNKDNLTSRAIIPKQYSQLLELDSPLLIFQQISAALPEDMIVSAIKWERSTTEEKIQLSLYIVDESIETSNAITLIKSFANELRIHLNEYQIRIASLPNKSADHETFSGSLQDQTMTIIGESNKAELEIVRKIAL